MDDAADAGEHPCDEGGEVGGERGGGGGDHSHGLSDEGGGVGHCADNPAADVGGWVAVEAVDGVLELWDWDTG